MKGFLWNNPFEHHKLLLGDEDLELPSSSEGGTRLQRAARESTMDSLFILRTQWVKIISSAVLAFLMLATPARADSNYWLFETGQVRPLAMSPDKKALFALNTP